VTEPKTSLANPAVKPDLYDHEYYLEGCMGSEQWQRSGGATVSGLYAGTLDLAGMEPGCRLLDIGTGRGELVRVASERGAAKAIGVDYSPTAIELAETTLAKAGNPPGAEVRLADARRIPVADGAFDLATMLDVVEHLTPAELDVSLAEARRALRPGGRLFIHTAPNALVYDVTYRIQRCSRPTRLRRWPSDPRSELERRMHVNEQRVGKLRRTLRAAGFDGVEARTGQWIETGFVPDARARRVYRLLGRVPGARRLAVFDLYATARKPG
jgi:ubiquinone/menaquinone biosynthesis C-methylase UbiE